MFSLKDLHEVNCVICNFYLDLFCGLFFFFRKMIELPMYLKMLPKMLPKNKKNKNFGE